MNMKTIKIPLEKIIQEEIKFSSQDNESKKKKSKGPKQQQDTKNKAYCQKII